MANQSEYSRFRTFTQILIVYTLFVILWGAWVRISGSGDGCGESWPLCHGQVLPSEADGKTWIELFHRITSGLYGFLVLGYCYTIFRNFSKGHILRKLGIAVVILTVFEALIGARLVIAGLVGLDTSFDRSMIMAVHLLNTFFLMGSLALSYELSFYKKPGLRSQPLVKKWTMWLALIGFLIVGMTGAFAALATTLFPSESLIASIARDLQADRPLYIQLRGLHPISAVLFIGFLYPICMSWLGNLATGNSLPRLRAKRLLGIMLLTGAVGVLTLVLLSPLWLKLSHLLVAQILGMTLLLTLSAFYIEEKALTDQQQPSQAINL